MPPGHFDKKGDETMMMDLQLFAGSLTVTVYKDSGIMAATASPASSLAEEDEVTLTITPATGKEIDDILVLSGGVTVDKATKKFEMGSSNVVLCVTSKKNNLYKVTENYFVCVNGVKTNLTRNMMLEIAKNGAIVGVNCAGTELTMNDALQNLIDTGVLVKM